MPLYEDRRNAQYSIRVSAECMSSVVMGSASVVQRILAAIQEKSVRLGRSVCVTLDGWYGVE